MAAMIPLHDRHRRAGQNSGPLSSRVPAERVRQNPGSGAHQPRAEPCPGDCRQQNSRCDHADEHDEADDCQRAETLVLDSLSLKSTAFPAVIHVALPCLRTTGSARNPLDFGCRAGERVPALTGRSWAEHPGADVLSRFGRDDSGSCSRPRRDCRCAAGLKGRSTWDIDGSLTVANRRSSGRCEATFPWPAAHELESREHSNGDVSIGAPMPRRLHLLELPAGCSE